MNRLAKLALMPLLFAAVLALAAPASAANLAQPKADKTSFVALSLQMVPSGWRLELTTVRGAGAIVRVDRAGRPSYYAGEGSCRSWSQQQLAAAYKSIIRSVDADHSDLPTVG